MRVRLNETQARGHGPKSLKNDLENSPLFVYTIFHAGGDQNGTGLLSRKWILTARHTRPENGHMKPCEHCFDKTLTLPWLRLENS